MKIKRRYSKIVSGFLISVSLALSISFFITIINRVPIDNFIELWLKSSLRGFLVGFPLSRLIVPTILNLVENMIEDEEYEKR